MTIKILPSNISSDRVIGGFSRYKGQNVIYWSDNNLITFDTYIRKEYIPTGKERVMLIKKGVEYRPDLVSFDVYGTPDAWWKIMEINKIYDILDFKVGVTIILPDSII